MRKMNLRSCKMDRNSFYTRAHFVWPPPRVRGRIYADASRSCIPMKTFLMTLLAFVAVFTNTEGQTFSTADAATASILTSQAQSPGIGNAPAVASEPITFEGWADGTVLTNQYPNVVFNDAVVLGPASLDLSDPNTGQLWVPYPPHSGTNVIYNPSAPLILTFSTPVNFVNGYFTYADGLVMQAYDSNHDLLATAQGANLYNWVAAPSDPLPNPSPNELIGVTLSSPVISSVVISSVDNTLGYGAFTADDISFTGSVNLNPVPEPSSVILLGAALLAGGYLHGFRASRARRRSTS
jgi:hypothetical protein